MRVPPPLDVGLSWRELYEAQAFAQRELSWRSQFETAATERNLHIGAGQRALEDLDLSGALQPVAFADGGYSRGFRVPVEPVERISFREEQEARSWESYGWKDAVGYEAITALYSPWQLLYLDDVLDATGADLSLETLLLADDERTRYLEHLRSFLQSQFDRWRTLDEAWRPLIKVLVRLQNYYWPRVSGRLAVVAGPAPGSWIEAGEEAASEYRLDAQALLERLGSTPEQLIGAYQFLVERGLDREPKDGLVMLRRAIPRDWHIRWRGSSRRAQDHFDAAEVLRRFLTDATGEQPPRPTAWPLDGRQPERARLYERGPATSFDRDELKGELNALELYPHGVAHVVGEGESEARVVATIISALLGWPALRDVTFGDLGGAGAAPRVEQQVVNLKAYTLRTLVVVDREGDMARYVDAAVKRGTIDGADVMQFTDSLEGSNATPQELIELAREIASNPPPGREAVELRLDPKRLVAFHEDRRKRSGKRDKPGIADSLIKLASRDEHGPVKLEKLAIVEALAEMLVRELDEAQGRDGIAEVRARRPIVDFVFERLVPVLARPRPAGAAI